MAKYRLQVWLITTIRVSEMNLLDKICVSSVWRYVLWINFWHTHPPKHCQCQCSRCKHGKILRGVVKLGVILQRVTKSTLLSWYNEQKIRAVPFLLTTTGVLLRGLGSQRSNFQCGMIWVKKHFSIVSLSHVNFYPSSWQEITCKY